MKRLKNLLVIIHQLNAILSARKKRLGALVLFLSFCNGILQMLGVSAIVPVVTLMTEPEKVMQNPLAKRLGNILDLHSFSDFFWVFCVGIILLYLFKNVFAIFVIWIDAKYAYSVQREISQKVLENYMERNYSFFLFAGSGRIVRDIVDDPESARRLLLAVFNTINDLIIVLILLLYIVISDWQMALFIGCFSGASVLLVFFVFQKITSESGRKAREAYAERSKIILAITGGIKEVQVMRKQKYFSSAFWEAFLRMQKSGVVQEMSSSSTTHLIEGLLVSGIMIYMAIRSQYDPAFLSMLPMLASFAICAIRMLPSLGRLSGYLNLISYFSAGLNSVYHNVQSLDEHDIDYSKPVVEENKVGYKKNFENCLELSDISWHYMSARKNVLEDLSLKIKKGQSVGIIGASGAGKSTLADIILGLHYPQKGQVLLDGIDIHTIPDDWSHIVGFVSQSVYLIEGTVRENIAFGVPENEVDEDAIWQALEQAQIAEFIRGTDNGLDTLIGERGVRFSGGQRQRMAIARALYRKPQILVLDEATSALDNETEAAVMEAIERLYGTVTMIIIAHRLTTVKKCDVVYEIKDGAVIK